MARANFLAAVLTGAVFVLPCTANAVIAATTTFIQETSGLYFGDPDYSNVMRTIAVFVLFQNPGDRLISTSEWNMNQLASSCIVNADPVSDDPLGLIDDAHGGDVPVAPGILSQPGYGVWRWDTNLSIDNSPQSQPEPGTMLAATHITGGASVPWPGLMAGSGLMVQVAQITAAGLDNCHTGTFLVTYLDASSQVTRTATMLSTCIHFLFPGDLNADSFVDTLDLGILLSQWSIPAGSSGCGGDPCCHADLNSDGQVNSLDLGILLVNWTEF